MLRVRKFARFVLHRPLFYRWGKRLIYFLRIAESRELTYRFRSCGEDVDIYSPTYISSPEMLSVGDRVSFAPFVHIWADGGVRIGNRVMVGSHSAITSLTHDYQRECMQDTLIKREVVIEDDVWIGTHAIIMPGVTIGRGAVIGAACVVTKDVIPFSVVVGGPGELLKMRETDDGVVQTNSFRPDARSARDALALEPMMRPPGSAGI